MKLIIDIPDEIYDDIKHGYICSEYADTLIQLIPSSKPYEERPQGEWIRNEEIDKRTGELHPITFGGIVIYTCSICGSSKWGGNFCPNCGAQMIKEVKKNDAVQNTD